MTKNDKEKWTFVRDYMVAAVASPRNALSKPNKAAIVAQQAWDELQKAKNAADNPPAVSSTVEVQEPLEPLQDDSEGVHGEVIKSKPGEFNDGEKVYPVDE